MKWDTDCWSFPAPVGSCILSTEGRRQLAECILSVWYRVCQNFCVYEAADFSQEPSGQTSYILQKNPIFFNSDLGTSEPRSLYLIMGLGLIYSGRQYSFAVFGVDLPICTQPNTKAPLVLLKMSPKAHSALETTFRVGLVQDQWAQTCKEQTD